MRPRFLATLLGVAVASSLLLPAGQASASFPGYNGKLAFSRQISSSAPQVWTLSGHTEQRLTSGSANVEPAWSPDGTKIAFVSDRESAQRDIFVMDADGSQQTRVTTDLYWDQSPAWSPDGSRIVFESNRGGILPRWDLYITDGITETKLTDSAATYENPEWSPDGSRIAFETDRDGNREIYLINVDGTGLTRLTNHPASDTDPTWAPDGSKIAFVTTRDGNEEIYWTNGYVESRVTNNTSPDIEPAWSPDGTKIAYATLWGQSLAIWEVKPDGTGAGPLWEPMDPGPSDRHPSWETLPAPPPQPDWVRPNTYLSRPKHLKSYYQSNLTTITGTASDAGSGVKTVQIALRKYRTDGRCSNFNGSNFVIGSCKLQVWLNASGTAGWSYRLPFLLQKSKNTTAKYYVVLARATDTAGNTETVLQNGRNRAQFEVI